MFAALVIAAWAPIAARWPAVRAVRIEAKRPLATRIGGWASPGVERWVEHLSSSRARTKLLEHVHRAQEDARAGRITSIPPPPPDVVSEAIRTRSPAGLLVDLFTGRAIDGDLSDMQPLPARMLTMDTPDDAVAVASHGALASSVPFRERRLLGWMGPGLVIAFLSGAVLRRLRPAVAMGASAALIGAQSSLRPLGGVIAFGLIGSLCILAPWGDGQPLAFRWTALVVLTLCAVVHLGAALADFRAAGDGHHGDETTARISALALTSFGAAILVASVQFGAAGLSLLVFPIAAVLAHRAFVAGRRFAALLGCTAALIAQAIALCCWRGEETLFESDRATDIATLLDSIALQPWQSGLVCACFGGPTIELYDGSKLIRVIGVQHGKALRMEGEHRGDLELTGDSRAKLRRWMAERSIATDWTP